MELSSAAAAMPFGYVGRDGNRTALHLVRQAVGFLFWKVPAGRINRFNQINRFLLNPGYQLCYSLGRYEIMQLKEGFGTNTGPETFHRYILEGGELPFHLIAKRFEKMSME